MKIKRRARLTKKRTSRLLRDDARLTRDLSRMRHTIATMKAMLRQYEQSSEEDGGQSAFSKARSYKLPIVRINHYEI